MKQGQTYHEVGCNCGWCLIGDTKHPMKEIKINRIEPDSVSIKDMKCQATFKDCCQYPKCDCNRPVTSAVINSTEFPRDKRLAEIEANLAEGYVGGMTEYWQRQKDFLLSEKRQEIADVLDGPEQECYPLDAYVTDPSHGGKVICHKCGCFIQEKDHIGYRDHQHNNEFPKEHFHKDCYNPYEHYYGLDRPID